MYLKIPPNFFFKAMHEGKQGVMETQDINLYIKYLNIQWINNYDNWLTMI